MSFITNIVFWLTSAMQSVVVAITVALILFIVSLLGFGFGVGRIWNTKWKLSAPCLLVSLPIALLTACLGAVHVGMGFIDKTVLSKESSSSLILSTTESLVQDTSLMELAFQSGLKKMLNANTDIDSIESDAISFEIPGNTPEERTNNEQAFIAGAMDAIVKGKKPSKGKGARSGVKGLESAAPFCYGYTPTGLDDNNGTVFGNYIASKSAADEMELPISCEDGKAKWFEHLVGPVVDYNMNRFKNNVCKKLEDQQSSLIMLIVLLLLIQTGLISWLAFIDIKPIASNQN